MNSLLGATLSPISIENTSSASTASSIDTCNKVLFATQLSKADNCVAFLWAMEQSPCLHVSPPTEKITKGGNNERKLYERKASISTAGFDGASNGNLDAGQFLI